MQIKKTELKKKIMRESVRVLLSVKAVFFFLGFRKWLVGLLPYEYTHPTKNMSDKMSQCINGYRLLP